MTTDDFLYATGRIVQGDIFTPQTKNMTGGPLTNLRGEPKIQYFMALAVAKTDPGLPVLQQTIAQIAAAGFPGGESNLPAFAWKMIDGDVAPNNTKTGFPGHIIFRFTSGWPAHVCTQGGAAQITDPEAVKRGYYVRVVFQAKANGNQAKPGLYLNHKLVELIGYGEIIHNGPDAAALLGNAGAVTLPVGASATPVASGPPTLPPMATPVAGMPGTPAPAIAPVAGMPGTPAPAIAPVAGMPGTPAPAIAPVAGMPGTPAPAIAPVAGMPGTPAPAIAPVAGMPGTPAPAIAPVAGMPGTPAPAIAPVAGMPGTPAPDFLTPPVLTALAGGVSYQQFIDKGWTDETLRASGYLA